MLIRLEITNFALIEHAVIDASAGLSVITGETGAGKSLLIGAIGAITGARVSRELVQTGKDRARVEACFSDVRSCLSPELLAAAGLADDPAAGAADAGDPAEDPANGGGPAEDPADADLLILSREIEAGGRTWSRINGRLVPLSLFRSIGSHLADIHGQNENQALFDPATHAGLLDAFAGGSVAELLQSWRTYWRQGRDLERRLGQFGLTEAERAREMDLLQYQVNEIRSLDPKIGEEQKLQRHRDLQLHAERLSSALSRMEDLLSGGDETDGVLGRLGDLSALIDGAIPLLPQAADAKAQVLTAQDLLTDVRHAVERFRSQIEFNPQLLEKIDARLDRLSRLRRKYGDTVESVLDFARQAERRLSELTQSEARIAELSADLAAVREALADVGARLTAARSAAGRQLSEQIGGQLAELGMPAAVFSVQFRPAPPGPTGADSIEFLLSANRGEPLKPLARMASGGEAARIMLAIKLILAEADRTPLLIFDEVDAGISGRISELVGRKLAQLGRQTQVFCVTHTAQIAAMADHQLMIEKQSGDRQTRTRIVELTPDQRVDAIARLLSGDQGSEKARELAGELLAGRIRAG